MANISLRQATAHDLDALVCFNQAMAKETEGKGLNEDTLRGGVNGLLSHPEYGFYLVAEQEGQIVGSLAVTFEWSDWRNAIFWWIQSVYVSPQSRRQGIYASLYATVQEMAKEQGNVCGFRLYVEKDNQIAQQTYQKLGMQECQYYMYESQS